MFFNWPGNSTRRVSASSFDGVYLGFAVQTPFRVNKVAALLNDAIVYEHQILPPYNGAQESGLPLKARGVPPGTYRLRIMAWDEAGCVGSTGAVRLLQVTP